MRRAPILAALINILLLAVFAAASAHGDHQVQEQVPLLQHALTNRSVSPDLFTELEELARIVDISYCVGLTSLGINKPFSCLSRCKDFPKFELVTTWNTGPLLSDSCGYIALDHGKQRVIVAFRGTYSIANTVVDLSTVPQTYVPYPGEGSDDEDARTFLDVGLEFVEGIAGRAKRDVEDDVKEAPKCDNCTVHMGFHASWLHTRAHVLPELEKAKAFFPEYQLTLVGHSLGGAVAALAGLDLLARGYSPQITTFGEPRVGNAALAKYLDSRFDLDNGVPDNDTELQYRRVTHVDDPVPLLPLSEWGYTMHAGEIFISKPSLSPDIADLLHCSGDNDVDCIAGQDSTATTNVRDPALRKRDLLSSVKDEISDVRTEPWGIPSRYKLWQLFFAHRDYFWRLGLCVPGGDPLGGGGKYDLGQD
jgi:predicted lipase